MSGTRQGAVPAVPERATQGTDVRDRERWWMEASIWTERMVSALVNGVRGGKWFSLIDKVYRPATLQAAWRKVERNKGTASMAKASSGSRLRPSGMWRNFRSN
jgi:hypothetical protein